MDVVLPLLEGAKSKIYFQNQYINESLDERATANYVAMIEAIAKKQQEGLDVRIILRSDTGVEARHIEFMKTHGIDMTRVRWRARNHTKGIIIDSARVLLGSHNWSFDGTVLNRDASLLFYDVDIAKYLEGVFIYDWENWSRTKSRSVRRSRRSPRSHRRRSIVHSKMSLPRRFSGPATLSPGRLIVLVSGLLGPHH